MGSEGLEKPILFDINFYNGNANAQLIYDNLIDTASDHAMLRRNGRLFASDTVNYMRLAGSKFKMYDCFFITYSKKNTYFYFVKRKFKKMFVLSKCISWIR